MISTIAQFNVQAKRAETYLARKLNLKEIRLPAGDCGSINIGWGNNGAAIKLDPNVWLSEGYDGVHLIGDQKTSLRCTSWDGITLAVKRHNGVVQVSGVDWYGGTRCLTQFGEQNFDGDRRPDGSLIQGTQRVTCPKFMLRVYESKLLVPPPSALGGKRGFWGLFSYQADSHLRDVEGDATEALEHFAYEHGNAYRGTYWQRVKIRGAAGENDKNRSDASETAWAGSNLWTIRKNCELSQWGQPWGNWREGGGIIRQNSGHHGLVEDTVLRGRDGHSKCLMLSSEGNSYDMETGKLNRGFGNGAWVVRRSGLTGANSSGFWNNTLVNVYRNGGTAALAAQGFIFEDSGAYGLNSQLSLNSTPAGTVFVQRCNTPAIKQSAERLGIDTSAQAVVPTSQRLVPVSEGYSR